jgi:hypothetical protein
MSSSNLPNNDRLFGIAAFLISMGTFFVYIYEARLLQKQQYASALPYLEMWNSKPKPGIYKLVLVNNGVGPAFIKDIKVHYRGKVYKGDHVRFYQTVIPQHERIQFLNSNIPVGRVIPAGQSIDIISLEGSLAAADRVNKLFGDGKAKDTDKAKIEITYSSVYDETWRVFGMQGAPQKLDD